MVRRHIRLRAIVFIGVIVVSAFENHLNASTFSLELQAERGDVRADAPIPIRLKLSYKGKEAIRLIPLDSTLRKISVEGPIGWEVRAVPAVVSWDGALPQALVQEGQTLEHVIYLHQYFSRITPGEGVVLVTINVPSSDHPSEPTTVTASATLHIQKGDREALEKQIGRIAKEIQASSRDAERLLLYRSLEYIDHPEVIPVMLSALQEQEMRLFHDQARQAITRLCVNYRAWHPVIDYLIDSGSRADHAFFTFWKRNVGLVSESQVRALAGASDLWVRLFTLETFGDLTPNGGWTQSLRSEVSDLLNRLATLPSSTQSATSRPVD